jgi:hypothetical protein
MKAASSASARAPPLAAATLPGFQMPVPGRGGRRGESEFAFFFVEFDPDILMPAEEFKA